MDLACGESYNHTHKSGRPDCPASGLALQNDTMLRFKVYRDGQPAEGTDLAGAYLFGQDGIPVRADIVSSRDQITCMKRVGAACGLSLLWDVGQDSRYLLSTTRLPERPEPYNLNLELLRAQIMLLYQKREDWALFDLPEAEQLNDDFTAIREAFLRALVQNVDDPATAAKIADDAMEQTLAFAERLALFHSDVVLKQHDPGMRRLQFGTRIQLRTEHPGLLKRMREGLDFALLPMTWRAIEPTEGKCDFSLIDAWVNWANREGKTLHAGPLLSFQPEFLPEWLYQYESDFDELRDRVFDHIQQIVKRYDDVKVWHVLSGLNAVNTFNLSFDQIMELTRTCCQLTKTLAPDAKALIDITLPFGEYYARNQRTIPPILYADMTYQSNIKFDAFGIQLAMGIAEDGYYVRDLLRISSLLDEFQPHAKDVYITAAGVPSENDSDSGDASGGQKSPAKGGAWQGPWTPDRQARWLRGLIRLAMSKPYVKGICWRDLADLPGHYLPHGGLCTHDNHGKPAWKTLLAVRNAMIAGRKPSSVGSEIPEHEQSTQDDTPETDEGPRPATPGKEG
jgi:hypothetical protein